MNLLCATALPPGILASSVASTIAGAAAAAGSGKSSCWAIPLGKDPPQMDMGQQRDVPEPAAARAPATEAAQEAAEVHDNKEDDRAVHEPQEAIPACASSYRLESFCSCRLTSSVYTS